MELKEYIQPLLKWWWLVVAATLLAGISSYLVVRQEPLIYQSRTTLMIGRTIDDPNPTNNQFFLSQQLAQIYADMAQREGVRKATQDALGVRRLPDYIARALPNSQIIEIAVVDTNPERAQAVATELTNQLILLSPSNVQPEEQERQSFVNQQLDDLQEQIQATQAEIKTKQEELGELFSARQITDTQSGIAALEAKRNTLQNNYAALLSSTQQGAINALTVIEPASLPVRPIGPDQQMTIITAAAIGLVLAASAAYVLEYLDDTVKTPEDIARISPLPVLTGIAHIKSDEEDRRLYTLKHPRSPISEAFRGLRTSIQFTKVDDPIHTLMVTSSNPAEGKSFTAANLALVMAQAGYKVLLIDCDLRRPTVHTQFSLSQNRGLTNFLTNANILNEHDRIETPVLDQYVQAIPDSDLYVLTSGPIPPNPSELLGSTKMKTVLEALEEAFDYIVLDTAPVLAVTDSVVLGAHVDGVVFVVSAGKTRRSQYKQAVEQLQRVNASVIGVSLNDINRKDRSQYYHYYESDYSADTEAEAEPQASANGTSSRVGWLGKRKHA